MEQSTAFAALGVGVALFASTNIDDIFLLAAFFADPHLRPRNIVAGQFLGITGLTAASAAAALAALAIPEAWTALLGIAPLLLGVRKLWELRTRQAEGDDDERLRNTEHEAERRTHSQVLAVAAVTVANGGDNLGVYIPVFAQNVSVIPAYVVIFAVMTALWCVMGYALVNNRVAAKPIRRYGHIVLPIVLIALGAWILKGALALFATFCGLSDADPRLNEGGQTIPCSGTASASRRQRSRP